VSFNEAQAIALFRQVLKRRNPEIVRAIGDDAALYRDGLVVTTDAYLEDVHFDRSYLDLSAIGARAVCGTLSDIAAMCARPTGVFISLMLPTGTSRAELRELYSGIDAVCSQYKTEVAGGDIIAAPKLGLALTALGRARRARLRSGARAGDHVYVTGDLALAETGRLVLKNGLDARGYGPAIARHVLPWPRIREARRLARHIGGLIDTSDGLSTDAGHLATESRVKVIIDYAALPVTPSTVRLCASRGQAVEQFVLSSGEDYELLFTSRNPDLPGRILGTRLTRIGRVEAGRGVWLQRAGRCVRLRPTGYDHLADGEPCTARRRARR
jgi:thiamine-monophosphate kinase